jgi:hypothetical protein
MSENFLEIFPELIPQTIHSTNRSSADYPLPYFSTLRNGLKNVRILRDFRLGQLPAVT